MGKLPLPRHGGEGWGEGEWDQFLFGEEHQAEGMTAAASRGKGES